MDLKITISIDDVNPGKGWRILGDPTEKWLRSLNEEFGAKFTLFVPSNYHQRYPISHHKEWVNELASIDWLEIAAHGHYHQTSDPKRFGECEFFEIQDEKIALGRVEAMANEWIASGLWDGIKGFRAPGWIISKESKLVLDNTGFDYIAIHQEHNLEMDWFYTKTFFGHDGIQQENISIHNVDESYPENPTGMIMYTSHISGNWNHNVWNETNYKQLRMSLTHLVEQYNCEFKTLKECI